MKKAIGAVLFHCSDINDTDRHKFCPRGSASWCKWQQDQINKTNRYKQKLSLPASIKQLIEPIFKDLSRGELLEKCLHGQTQNVNEAFNQILWNKCPKNIYVGKDTLELGVSSAVLQFNDGASGFSTVLSLLGIPEGSQTQKVKKLILKKYKKRRDLKRDEEVKTRRKKLRSIRKGFLDKEKEEEGSE